MYTNRRRTIVIVAVIVIIAVIVLTLGGLLLYLNTDLFKSNETLFYKYMGQTFENLKFEQNEQFAQIEELSKTVPYETKGTLTLESSANQDSSSEMLSDLNLNLESKVDISENKAYGKANLKYKNEDIVNFEYAKNNDIFALYSSDIAKAYIGIENDNLKVLAQKLGINDTEAIPNKIEIDNSSKLTKITDEEKEHITETYFEVLKNNISDKNFAKESNVSVQRDGVIYNATGYRLKLTAEDIKQTEIAMLQTLQQDSITLNIIATKAKELGLEDSYTQINSLNKEIDKLINEINNTNIDPDQELDIVVYVDGGKVITTELIVKNEMKATIYGQNQTNSNVKYLLIENLSNDDDFSKFEIRLTENKNMTSSTYNLQINLDDETMVDGIMTNTGSANENYLNTTLEITASTEDNDATVKYEQEMKFGDIDDIIKLDRKTNCIVLNDYTTEQIQYILNMVSNRVSFIFNNSLEKIKALQNSNNSNAPVLQSIDTLDNTNTTNTTI